MRRKWLYIGIGVMGVIIAIVMVTLAGQKASQPTKDQSATAEAITTTSAAEDKPTDAQITAIEQALNSRDPRQQILVYTDTEGRRQEFLDSGQDMLPAGARFSFDWATYQVLDVGEGFVEGAVTGTVSARFGIHLVRDGNQWLIYKMTRKEVR